LLIGDKVAWVVSQQNVEN